MEGNKHLSRTWIFVLAPSLSAPSFANILIYFLLLRAIPSSNSSLSIARAFVLFAQPSRQTDLNVIYTPSFFSLLTPTELSDVSRFDCVEINSIYLENKFFCQFSSTHRVRARRVQNFSKNSSLSNKFKMKILMRADTHVNIEIPGNAPVAKCTFSQVQIFAKFTDKNFQNLPKFE